MGLNDQGKIDTCPYCFLEAGENFPCVDIHCLISEIILLTLWLVVIVYVGCSLAYLRTKEDLTHPYHHFKFFTTCVSLGLPIASTPAT